VEAAAAGRTSPEAAESAATESAVRRVIMRAFPLFFGKPRASSDQMESFDRIKMLVKTKTWSALREPTRTECAPEHHPIKWNRLIG
jgi:hypothetical protein